MDWFCRQVGANDPAWIGRFVGLMNERAAQWGLECTHFASSHGLENGNRSCARDLAVMTRLAMSKRRIRKPSTPNASMTAAPVQGRADAATGATSVLARDDEGVLVRDVGIAHYLRVTAGTPEETSAFLDAVAALGPDHLEGQS